MKAAGIVSAGSSLLSLARQRVSGTAEWLRRCLLHPMPAADSGLTLASVLLAGSGLFVLATLFFGTKGGYYDTDDYDGNGTAH